MSASQGICDAIGHIDRINENLRRVKSLADLAGAATRQSEIDIEESMLDVTQMIWEFADAADRAACCLFDLVKKSENGGNDATP